MNEAISHQKRVWPSGGAALLVALLLAACAPAAPLPTLVPSPQAQRVAQLPTASATASPSATHTPRPTLPPTYTPTDTPTITLTATLAPTRTPYPPTQTFSPTPSITPTPNYDALIVAPDGAFLRAGPDTGHRQLALLPDQTPLRLLGLSVNRMWVQANTLEGERGWVRRDLLAIVGPSLELAVIEIPTVTPPPVIVVAAPAQVASSGTSGGGSGVGVSARVQQIFASGQAMGNNRRVFVKVGDSITHDQPFFGALDWGQYNLGGQSHLQATVNHFQGSFGRVSIASNSGMNAAAMMDAIWAPKDQCAPNESPLSCEYRLQKPVISVIMLGSVDVQLYDTNAFNGFYNTLVQTTINAGIIPVLTTFPNSVTYFPDNSESFNNVIRSIAASNQVPLIELRNPALGMNERGVLPDGFHLTQHDSGYIDFNGDEGRFALTLRALLTLQALDTLRVGLGL